MFHLWRKRRSLALFPHQVLLDDGSDPLVLQPDRPDQPANGALFAALDGILLDAKCASRRKIRLSLAVSDSFAAIVALPWQPALTRAAEIDAYARVQFERSGQPLDERWLMLSFFRHFGATGLAYALPVDFVQRLCDIALAHDVVIDSILPLSALAHARQRRSKRGTTALVVREASRVTAFVADQKGLLTYATEPAAGAKAQPVERLLRRLQAECELQAVEGCAPEPGIDADLSALVERVLPSARCAVADPDFWRR